jgi:hypothetical protein
MYILKGNYFEMSTSNLNDIVTYFKDSENILLSSEVINFLQYMKTMRNILPLEIRIGNLNVRIV